MKRIVALLVLAACSHTAGPPEPAPGCNPLIGDDCMTPYPSAFYQGSDGHVAIPDGVLPAPQGQTLVPDRLNTHDGFSPASPFYVYFKQRVDASELPAADAPDLSATAHVQILDYATGERVPLFAELDGNITGSADRQALIIHPLTRLAPSTRYVIALVGLDDASGDPLVAPGFAALRDKTQLNAALEPLVARYEDLFAMLGSAGIARDQLTLAWDVTTASDADATSHLFAMRDQALAMVDQLSWTITSETDTGSDPERIRELVGTFDVPSFLTDDSLTGTLLTDGSGAPMLRATFGTADFVIEVPACAATQSPVPVVFYGHGLFGNAKDELESSYQRQMGQTLCMVQIGTDWLGLDSNDVGVIAGSVVPDFNQLHIVTDQLQQAHINAQVLTRLVLTRMNADPALQGSNGPFIDGSAAYYFGCSNGGIQGTTYLALSEDVTRAALNVPGAEWSLLMWRSSDFAQLVSLLSLTLPDKLDQQLLVATFQPEFDYTDPASFAAHLGSGQQVLLQEGIGDDAVTNLATRELARQLGVPGLDLEQPVYGITAAAAPLPSAYTQYDIMPSPLPPVGDVPPSGDNGVHGTTRELVAAEQQIKAFLAPGGAVTDVCGGSACVCDEAAGTCSLGSGM